MKKKFFAALTAVSVTASAAGAVIADAAIAKGDTNESSTVEIADATAVLSYYAENAASLSPVFSTDSAKNNEIFTAADVDGSGEIDIRDATLILTYYARTAASIETDWESLISGENSGDIPELGTPDGTLGEGGDTLTIMSFTDYYLQDMYSIVSEATGIPESMMIYKNVGEYGSEASTKYAQALASGDDIDIYLCDSDWASDYINNSEYSAPLSAVGITEEMYANALDYTVEIGKDNNGVLKAATWDGNAGGYVYRTDLAELYLGITDPADMQALISDWNGFWETAEKIHTASGGVTAMADSLGGVIRPYLTGSRNVSWTNDNNVLSSANIRSELEWMIPELKSVYDAGYISHEGQWTMEWLPQGMSAGNYADKTFGFFFASWNLSENAQLAQAQGEEGAEGSTYGMYNIVPGPAEWFWGGTYMCVSPNTDNATEAGKFIYSMTVDKDSMKKYAGVSLDLPTINNKSVVEDLAADASFNNQYLGGQNPYPALMESAEKVDGSILSEYDDEVMWSITKALGNYFDGRILNADTEKCMDRVIAYLEEDGLTIE